MSCLPVSAMLTLRPSTPPTKYHFNGGVDPGRVPEPEECPLDANNALDTMVAEVLGEDPTTSQKKGSFYFNKKGTYYTLKWANSAEFNTWHQVEEANNSIGLWKSTK